MEWDYNRAQMGWLLSFLVYDLRLHLCVMQMCRGRLVHRQGEYYRL